MSNISKKEVIDVLERHLKIHLKLSETSPDILIKICNVVEVLIKLDYFKSEKKYE